MVGLLQSSAKYHTGLFQSPLDKPTLYINEDHA
eukprot:COSAG02_NODE_61277_length_269_cov_0.605882_1_plen_32_part_01